MGLFSSDNKAAGGSAEELFEAGDKAYENKDYVKAAQFYKKAAELGHVKAMSFLAYAYRFGEGVKENPEEAFYWYKKTYQSGKNMMPETSAVCIIIKKSAVRTTAK